ncbi:MAG: DNA internalization-related competence protein ComEC/Rec2 [Nitrospiria bacterium]
MGKKPLVALTLAFIGGLLFGEAFSYFPLTLSLFVLLLIFLEGCFLRSTLIPMSLIAVWGIGFFTHQTVSTPFFAHDLRHFLDQGPVKIRAQVTEAPRHAPGYVALQMKALAIFSQNTPQPASGAFQLFISEEDIPFEYGDQLEMTLRLRRPREYRNPGTFLYADYQRRIGRDGMAWLPDFKGIQKTGNGGNPLLKSIYRWREDLRHKILDTVNAPASSVLMAMLIGESGYLNDETRETFINAGLAHLLAVSGTHLAFIALFVFTGSRGLILRLPENLLIKLSTRKLPTQWATLPTALTVTFYTFLAGGKIGTLRALTMILIYLFSIWIGRRRDLSTSLALAALFILLSHPRAVFEISFLLSFTAVLVILLFSAWREKQNPASGDPPFTAASSWIQTALIKPLSFVFFTSLSAAIGTAPLTLYFFHQFSWVGFVSNVILTPAAGWLFIPFSLICAILSLGADTFLFPEWHEGIWGIFLGLTRFFAALPGADRHFAAPPLMLVLTFYGSLFFMLITQKSQKAVCIATFSFFAIFLGRGVLRIPPENPRVTFLDVGQGDAAFVEFPNGQTMLIDGGSARAGQYAVAPFLWQRRIRTIDTLIATHPQFDHIGGLPFILRNFKVNTVWTNGRAHDSDTFQNFVTALDQNGAAHRVMTARKPLPAMGNCTFSSFNPSKPVAGQAVQTSNKSNNHSLVFRMSCKNKDKPPVSFLFTGDIEEAAEARILRDTPTLQSTILKTPHHGSRSSSSVSFIAAVSPKIALFSAGRNNRYRHPHPDILKRYETRGAAAYRTDEAGAVMIEIGEDLSVTTDRDTRPDPVQWSRSLFRQEVRNLKKLFTVF